MPHDSDQHLGSLLTTVTEQHGYIHEFANVHSEVWEIVEGHILAARALSQACLNYSCVNDRTNYCSLLLRSCCEYLEDSVCLIIHSRQDAAFTLLRNAAETARTAARISESDGALTRWRDHRKDPSKYPRPRFQFNDYDALEKSVHELFKICSGIGTHNHLASMAFKSDRSYINNSRFVSLMPTDIDVLKSLTFWFTAVPPILVLTSKGFIAHFNDNHDMEYKMVIDLLEKLSPAVTYIKESLGHP